MTKVRAELGEDAVVLSNRACEGGVEILALPGGAIDSFAARAPAAVVPSRPVQPPVAANGQPQARPAPHPAAERVRMAMRFEDYVRERFGRPAERAAEESRAVPAALTPQATHPAPAAPRSAVEPGQGRSPFESAEAAGRSTPIARAAASAAYAQAAVPVAPAAPVPPAAQDDRDDPWLLPGDGSAASGQPSQPPMPEMVAEAVRTALGDQMTSLRRFIGDQVANVAWLDGVRRSPLQMRLLRRLLDNGFSAAVTRKVISQLPAGFGEREADAWLRDVVTRNLKSDVDFDVLDRGGVFALIGPTGVGKTTTTAKIAAQFALRHGTQSLGLITIDTYRVGAHDQLRAFGRILGVPVHVAHDAATLADFLQVFASKRLVLIDTVGVGQRDERVQELLASLAAPQIRKLVVLNAAAQAATIDDVVAAYRASQAAGVVISKVDEAVALGGVVDCAMRHRLRVVGVADGQRVPEDWHAMPAAEIARRALAERPRSVFSIEDAELPAIWGGEGVESRHA